MRLINNPFKGFEYLQWHQIPFILCLVGGTFRLSFVSKAIAETAKLILSDLGFKFRD